MQDFDHIRAFIIDMDGVLWHGEKPLPGLTAFFQTLRDLNLRFILATNNASLTAEQYRDKLAGMGVVIHPNEVITSGMATALYLAEHSDPLTARVFVIGESGARQPLLDLGFKLMDIYEPVDLTLGPHFVVCGKDKDLSWDKLATATLNIRAGATFIGANNDTTLPTERGVTHGNGAVIAALKASTDVEPIIIGKPEPVMYRQALAILGVDPAQTVAIGDRLGTDILGAVRAGIRSLLVLSGVSSEEELKSIDYQPTWVMPDIQAITQALRQSVSSNE